jgi:hypothetical protein
MSNTSPQFRDPFEHPEDRNGRKREPKKFDDLAASSKEKWSDDAHQVYQAASQSFQQEMNTPQQDASPYAAPQNHAQNPYGVPPQNKQPAPYGAPNSYAPIQQQVGLGRKHNFWIWFALAGMFLFSLAGIIFSIVTLVQIKGGVKPYHKYDKTLAIIFLIVSSLALLGQMANATS